MQDGKAIRARVGSAILLVVPRTQVCPGEAGAGKASSCKNRCCIIVNCSPIRLDGAVFNSPKGGSAMHCKVHGVFGMGPRLFAGVVSLLSTWFSGASSRQFWAAGGRRSCSEDGPRQTSRFGRSEEGATTLFALPLCYLSRRKVQCSQEPVRCWWRARRSKTPLQWR